MERLNTRTTSERIALVMVALLAITVLCWLLLGCAWLCDAKHATEGAGTIGRTIKNVDQNKDGTISFLELISYMVSGYFGGRTLETAGRLGVRRYKSRKASPGGACDEA